MRDRAAARARPGLGPHRTGRPAGGGLEGATETRARALVGSLLLAACSELTPDRSHGGAVFVDRAAELGIALDFDRAREGHYFMPDSLAAGCAFLDYDRDGRLDVFLVNGHFSPEGRVDPEGVSRLFRQTADGRFVDVTASAGIGHRGYGMGVAVGDYDGDGYPDVYVTCYGRDALYRNRGDGTFIDVTEEVGLGHGGWGSSAGFFDAEADGDLDLFVVTYLDYSPEVRSVDQGGAPEYPGPSCCPGTPDVFYRNEGGRFRDVSAAAGISEAPGKGLGLAFGDLDEDGLVDVFVANDSEANRAWIQQDDGSFLDAGVPMGLAFDQFGAPEAGMGVVAADLDGDLTLDLVVTNLTKQTNTFYANGGRDASGTPRRAPGWGRRASTRPASAPTSWTTTWTETSTSSVSAGGSCGRCPGRGFGAPRTGRPTRRRTCCSRTTAGGGSSRSRSSAASCARRSR